MMEIYTFAANLASSNAGDSRVFVRTEIANINGRSLYQDNPYKTGIRHYSGPPAFVYPAASDLYIDREALVADPNGHAAQATSDLLSRFGFNVDPDGVRVWQADTR
jgi:hypothetical protein